MLRIIAAAALLAAGGLCASAAAGSCYSDWSIAAPIVRKEGLATVETLSEQARARISGDIIKTTLCEVEGSFVYRLVIRDPKGHFESRTVNARIPFPP